MKVSMLLQRGEIFVIRKNTMLGRVCYDTSTSAGRRNWHILRL